MRLPGPAHVLGSATPYGGRLAAAKLDHEIVQLGGGGRALRHAGLEGEMLGANQVVGYFACANRAVLGLNVTTDGDVLGQSPSNPDDPGDWGHR